MNIIAILLGAIGLVVVVLAWTVAYVRRRLRRGFARMQAISLCQAPGRISLRRLDPFKWNKASRAEQRVAAFRALGFEDLGGFTLTGVASARLFLLLHPAAGQVGLVQERDPAGTWSDVAFFPDNAQQPVYASSVLNKAHFYLFPGAPKIHLPDASEAELVAAVSQAVEISVRPAPVTTDNVAGLIEEAYAAAVDARLLEPLEDYEIRRLLREKQSDCADEALSEAKFQRIKEQIPFAVANELRRACRDQFLREGTISAREWQQAKERLLVVHDHTPLQELDERTNEAAFCLPSLKPRLKASAKQAGTPREKFATLNQSLPPWERYRKLGEVRRPVAADIYCAPEQRPST